MFQLDTTILRYIYVCFLGMKSNSVAALKVLRDYKVDLEKSKLLPDFDSGKKRYEISKESLKEMLDATTGT